MANAWVAPPDHLPPGVASDSSGAGPWPTLEASLRGPGPAETTVPSMALTVRGYFERWIVDRVPPEVRRTRAQDYRRHLRGYVLPSRGDPLTAARGPARHPSATSRSTLPPRRVCSTAFLISERR
jgi:hypothetical protein